MASNVITTADQVRQGFQQSATIDGLLKNVYIPALNNTTFHATPLQQMFGDFGGQIDFAGNKIIKAFKNQGAGGFGGISEGGDFVTGKDQNGFQGYERLKYLNAFFSLSGPAVATIRSGEGSYVDAVSSSMEDTLKLVQMQMERMLGGNGDGVLCTFKLTSGSANTIDTVTGTSCTGEEDTGAYTPVQWLQEGMTVDLHETLGSPENETETLTVTAIDRSTGKFTLTASTQITGLTAGAVLYLTLPRAYGGVEVAGVETSPITKGCLEPNGLGNLVAKTGSIWGRDRIDYPSSLNSMVEDALGAEIDEELLIGWLLDLVHINGGDPNVLITDPKSRLKYFSNVKEDRRFNTQVIDNSFGMRSIGVTIDNYELMLHSVASLTPGTLMMLNTSDFKWAKAGGGFNWLNGNGGGIMTQYEGRDAMFATATNYCNFVCENPKGQFKATGLAT